MVGYIQTSREIYEDGISLLLPVAVVMLTPTGHKPLQSYLLLATNFCIIL